MYDISEYYQKIINLQNKSILDFGCNQSNFLLHRSHKDYTGLDIDKKILKMNSSLFEDNLWVHYRHYNWQYNCDFDVESKWPLTEHMKYDAIIAFSVFTHTDFTEFKKTAKKLRCHLTSAGVFMPSFISTQDIDSLRIILKYRNEYFEGYEEQLIEKIQNSKTATIAVNTKTNQIHFYKNVFSIPRFSNQTYFLTFYNDDWLANQMESEVVDVTDQFDGIRGTQRCLLYTHR